MASALAVVVVILAHSADAACYDRDAKGRQTRFRLQGEEAFDRRTRLTWRRCSAGTSWSGKLGCVGETAYLGVDEAMGMAASLGENWRVPSGPELESLVDIDCGHPVVDTTVFPDIRPTEEGLAKYWTTNPVGMLDLYYNFDFIDGHADANTRGMQLAVPSSFPLNDRTAACSFQLEPVHLRNLILPQTPVLAGAHTPLSLR